jgi:hypothetical protein
VICAGPAIGAAALAMLAAWDHNPQGEFHELAADGSRLVHSGWWISVGLSWFLMIFVPLFLIGGIVMALSLHSRSRKLSSRQVPLQVSGDIVNTPRSGK